MVQVRSNAAPVIDEVTLDAMTDAMSHRGPNDRGTYISPGVALGVRRLSVVDVKHGHQPFTDEAHRVVAIQNGEIYNHDELRKALVTSGHRFATRCDTEVIPHLYEEYGERFPEHLRGMFAIALWDDRRRRAVLARDRAGIKPLYYAIVDDQLVFASELKSILASGLVPAELDYDALSAYLQFGFVPTPRTPLRAVRKLPPGTILIVEDGSIRTHTYWRPPVPIGNGDSRMGAGEHAERVLDQLDEAVRLRLMSDVPLGAMLSGGLDSSLVVALMARHSRQPVKTFSIGFADGGAATELDDARLVAAHFGTDHHELELSASDHSVDLARLVWHLDEPVADLSSLGFLALSELAASHVTVALSGQGADEVFGGYRRYVNAKLVDTWRHLPGLPLHGSLVLGLHGPRRLRKAAELAREPDLARRLLLAKQVIPEALRRTLARGPLETGGDCAYELVRELTAETTRETLPAALYLDTRLSLVDDMLHYFDRTSMAHSLEVRVPFLDHHLVEYAATIPSRFKVHRLTTKYLLKEVGRRLLPKRIVDKPKIGFFNNSLDAWIRGQLDGAIAEHLLTPQPRYAEFLDRATVEQLVRAYSQGNGGGAEPLLAILMLEVWLSSFLPRAMAASRPRPTTITLRA